MGNYKGRDAQSQSLGTSLAQSPSKRGPDITHHIHPMIKAVKPIQAPQTPFMAYHKKLLGVDSGK